jgi:Tfp pilus assembly protein PilX
MSGPVGRSGPRNDTGAALPLCLAVTIFLSLMVVGLLQVASSSIRSTAQLRIERQERYAADGAANLAIEYLRADPTRGVAGSPCPLLFMTINSVVATVGHTCTATPGAPDRSVELSVAVAAKIRSRVTVVIHDGAGPVGSPPLGIVSWVNLR